MARGRIEPPNLDDRTWRDIVEQAKALIPAYAPEWTDHNPSDLGIALIELFAWIVEGMIYRLNRVPEKNYVEFLNLLGITRDPAIPASTMSTFRTASSTPVIVPVGSQYSTLPTATEDGIVFETDRELTVLPINLTHVLLISRSATGIEKYKHITSSITGKPLSGIKIEIPTGEQRIIVLGFDASSLEQLDLICRFSQAIKTGLSGVQVGWIYPINETDIPSSWTKNPSIIQDETDIDIIVNGINQDQTKGLQKNGVVSLKLKADWQSQNPKDWTGITADGEAIDQKCYWLGFKLENSSGQILELGIEYILFNAVSATNALTVTQPETYISNGKPFQTFELKNAPLYKQTGVKNPYQHLEVKIREPQLGGGFEPEQLWTQVEDLQEGDVPCYRINPVSGTIYFGNCPKGSQNGNGRIPADGSEIQVVKYRYIPSIGSKGNVPADTIKVPRTPVDGIAAVSNPGAATGGKDEEDIQETKRRAPEILRNRNRAITVEDYEYLAREASTKVAKVRCLPPRRLVLGELLASGKKVGEVGAEAQAGDPWIYGSLNRSPGQVHLIIIPDAPNALNDPNLNPTPTPTLSEELSQEITEYLEARRSLTTKLEVHSGLYLPINVTAQIEIWPQAINNKLIDEAQFPKYKEEVERNIAKFLHPLFGGIEGKGWEIGQGISASNLLNIIQPEPDIGFVSNLQIQAVVPLYDPPRPYTSELGFWVQSADYEMICNGTHSIEVGKAS
jgi:Baseplate J-like protein